MAGMDETALKALVAREIELARSDGKRDQDRRTKALQYYQGEMPDLVPEPGRSRVVSKDHADVMGWMLPGIIRVFTASDRMALAEPVGAEDEQWAQQATDGLNYVFWKENDGYRIIHAGTWDALNGGNGVIKVWWDDEPIDAVSYSSGLTPDQLAELEADDEVEILAQSNYFIEVTDPESGMPVPVPLHDVKIRRQEKGGKVCIEAIPPEDYIKNGSAKTCEEARFQAHRMDKTRSDLVGMGFDRKTVFGLNKAGDGTDAETVTRTGLDVDGEEGDASMEVVDLYECYIRADVDDDGIAELCRVYYAGGTVLDWEVWDDQQPFHDIPCDPMPHKWQARSIFDETEDVQQIKTAMLRQANDNIYATNNPQRFVKGKILNPEELFSPNFGGAIFSEDANAEVTPLVVPFVANHAWDALNYQDQVIQRRTGVSRQTMALDPEALVNQSATANQNEKDASYSQIELIARNMAEFGWVKVFKAILRLLIQYQDVEKTIRLNKKPVKIDPRWWNADMDVTISTGLGTGSRDRDAQMLQAVLTQQMAELDRYVGLGDMESAIQMMPYIRNTQVKFAEAVGLRNPEAFYPEVDVEALMKKAAAKAQQPDPKIEAEKQKVMIEAQGEAAKAQMQNQLDQQKAVADIALKREEMQANLQIKREQLVAEMQLKERQLVAELALQRELGLANAAVKASTSGVHPGGEPG